MKADNEGSDPSRQHLEDVAPFSPPSSATFWEDMCTPVLDAWTHRNTAGESNMVGIATTPNVFFRVTYCLHCLPLSLLWVTPPAHLNCRPYSLLHTPPPLFCTLPQILSRMMFSTICGGLFGGGTVDVALQLPLPFTGG